MPLCSQEKRHRSKFIKSITITKDINEEMFTPITKEIVEIWASKNKNTYIFPEVKNGNILYRQHFRK